MESKIYIQTGMLDTYIGRCVNGKIYAGSGIYETQIGIYQDSFVYRGCMPNINVVGNYEREIVWSGCGLNKNIFGSYHNGKICEGYGVISRPIGHFEGDPIAAAAALLLRAEFERVNKTTYIASVQPKINEPSQNIEPTKKIEVKSNKTVRSNKQKYESNSSSYSGTANSDSRVQGTSSYTPYTGNSDGGSMVGGIVMSVVYLFLLFVSIWIVGLSSDTLDTFRDICLTHETTIEKIITFIVIAWSLYFPICSLVTKEAMLFSRCCIAGFVMLLGYGGLFFCIIHYAYGIYTFLNADILYYSGWFLHVLGVLFMPFIGMCLFAAPVLLLTSLFPIIFHNATVIGDNSFVEQSKFVGKASVYGGLILLTIYMLLKYSLATPLALFMQFFLYSISAYNVGKYASKMIDAYFIPENF